MPSRTLGKSTRSTGEYGGFGVSTRFYSKLAEIRINKKWLHEGWKAHKTLNPGPLVIAVFKGRWSNSVRVKAEVEVETVEIRKKLLPEVHMHLAQRSFRLSQSRQTTISVRCSCLRLQSGDFHVLLWKTVDPLFIYLPLCFASSETFLACSPGFLYCNRFHFSTPIFAVEVCVM